MDFQERENAKLKFKTVDRKKVESPHNYYPNTDEEKIIRIPGATHLCITFDERCNLVPRIWLQILLYYLKEVMFNYL